MTFKEIIGQKKIKERLIKSVKTGKIAHAQLFDGPSGAGKLALAIAYSQYISCTNKLEDDSCNACPSCVKINKLAHPDLHFAFPVATTRRVEKEPTSDKFLETWRETLLPNAYMNIDTWIEAIGTQNKQLAISKFEAEDIIRKLSLKSYESEYKIMIIWHADRLNAPASNKLLKIIEEPLENTLFILITEKVDAILPTIRSRTQLVNVPAIDDAPMVKYLSEAYGLDDITSQETASIAKGNMQLAVRLTIEEDDNINVDTFIDWMRLCYGTKVVEAISWSEKMAVIGRERQKNFFLYCLRMTRGSLIMNYEKQLVQLNSKEMSFVEKFSPFVDEINGRKMAELFSKAYADVERNANPKVMFLDLSLKLTKLLRPKQAA